MVLYLGMIMSDAIDWFGLVNDAETVKESPEAGDVPIVSPDDDAQSGTNKPSIYAGYSDISPESPESPINNQSIGHHYNLNTGGGVLDGKFFCDINRGVGGLVNLQLAPESGLDCQGCKHLEMIQFIRPQDRRLFHWRCTQGFNILEAGCAGERVLIAPPECNQYANG